MHSTACMVRIHAHKVHKEIYNNMKMEKNIWYNGNDENNDSNDLYYFFYSASMYLYVH